MLGFLILILLEQKDSRGEGSDYRERYIRIKHGFVETLDIHLINIL